MTLWPFGQRGGLTDQPFTSEDPKVCVHQAVRLKILLTKFSGRYEETWMVLNRLEIVYLCAGRREDADRVHADKIALVRRYKAGPASGDEGEGIIGRLKWWWQIRETEACFRHGQLVIDAHLAELHRLAPWESGQDADSVSGMA